jgi:hypothetical protein
MNPTEQNYEDQLNNLFGDYKAEWLRDRVFELFTKPDYLPDLTTARPCVLFGGRGTGKTTVLRGLSYEGQLALATDDKRVVEFPFYGMYYRVNTNRVTAFKGEELPLADWIKVFGHYINLLLFDSALKFLTWFRVNTNQEFSLSKEQLSLLTASVHLPACDSLQEVSVAIRKAQVTFEAYVNNVCNAERPPLSLQGAPLDLLFQFLSEIPCFHGKIFCFLIDEYENFEDYQQQVLNTLIKHSGQLYTFKIGIKELGWRRRSTLNENEQLVSPADYAAINISDRLKDDQFERFALAVCRTRLSKVEEAAKLDLDPRRLLPGLSDEEEAVKLGVEKNLDAWARQNPEAWASIETLSEAIKPSSLLKFFLLTWAESQKLEPSLVFQQYLDNPRDWNFRYGNYKYALLFSIRAGKVGIRKYFCGWSTFTQLAAGNIRYLLELLDQSMLLWLRSQHPLDAPISPEIQTYAAQAVGKKNVSELEGLSVHGAQLTKLVLGLGRVFQVMAAEPIGHTPEVNEFHLEEERAADQTTEADELLKAAVMHLALVRSPGNKAVDETETRDYDYALHPIFSPFFAFSSRRKRKVTIASDELLALVKTPKEAIKEILRRQNRSADSPLPEQAKLFETYYGQP